MADNDTSSSSAEDAQIVNDQKVYDKLTTEDQDQDQDQEPPQHNKSSTGDDKNNKLMMNKQKKKKKKKKEKWTVYLALCCVTACMASFSFGYNIGVTNLPTPLIKRFYARHYFPAFIGAQDARAALLGTLATQSAQFSLIESRLNESQTRMDEAHASGNATLIDAAERVAEALRQSTLLAHNDTAAGFLLATQQKLKATRQQLADLDEEQQQQQKNSSSSSSFSSSSSSSFSDDPEQLAARVDKFNTLLWTITTAIFVVGGMVGAFGSKYVADSLGRKKGILFHYVFSVAAAALVLFSVHFDSPECIIVSRFLYGIQGGMSCGLTPTYLSEISPVRLRGATGVIHQLFITVGILISQILGVRQLLGTADLWPYLLAVPGVTSLVGGLVLLLFFPETPRALLIRNNDKDSARRALQALRHTTNVDDDLNLIEQEARNAKTTSSSNNSSESSSSKSSVGIIQLFTIRELRWPMITGLVMQIAQQLCGINAVFYYSEGIFRAANIAEQDIQYAVVATGVINVILTVVCVPLIDRLGRKPLLVYPMILMCLDFVALTFCFVYQEKGVIYSYLSIVCIILFIMCFAVGLGPIPFIYVAEIFRQDARSSALAICMFTNWAANFVLAMTFPYLAKLLGNYVFLTFLVIVATSALIIIKKVPETKGRTVDENMAFFAKNNRKALAEETGEGGESAKLNPQNTNV